ncbi:venom serine protease-like isoform X2 [Bicyclus anynana]|nr:venom serine protease-like isoform X2 [Bicyclus anynana]XP_052744544.1 venom serine protease-like isoform X2 [Bicyclus anynana]
MYQSILVILLLFHCTHSQDANCDFSQRVVPGNRYMLASPNYPYSYNRGSQCRWVFYYDSGNQYNIRMDCSDINMPQSASCSVDRFLVSRSGDMSLSGADYYCGRGTLSAVSTEQRMTMAIIASPNSPGGSVYCEVYAQQATTAPTCNCGAMRVNRIVGGQETTPYKYPMMCGIRFNRGTITCGGTIITNNHVLTAAHAVLGKRAADTTVVAGIHNQNNAAQQELGVASILTHPLYNSNTYDYDIAILKTTLSFVFGDLVGPVCMPFKYANADLSPQSVIMTGWGTVYTGGPTSAVLREVNVNLLSQATCQSRITTVTPRQRCTFAQGKDACQYDSGGPVLYNDPTTGRLFLVGIISYGRFCASDSPGICTWVPSLLNWITQNAPYSYCYK